MPRFKFVALDSSGARLRGVVDGSSLVTARDQLLTRRLDVLELHERKHWWQIELTAKTIKPLDIMNFSRQLAAFMRAGVPILDALQSLTEETDRSGLRDVLVSMSDALRAGSTFADALATHSVHFPSYYIGIVRSAELTGNLDTVLDQLADYIERDQEARRAVKAALVYPAVVMVMSVFTIIVLTAYVLPRFETFFESFDAKLPFVTRLLLDFSHFLERWWPVIVAVIVGGALLLWLYLRTESGKYRRDQLLLWLPALGVVVRYAIIERFCRILAAMLDAGVPVGDALGAATNASNNLVYERGLTKVSEEVLRGRGIAAPIAESGLFPPAANQMIRVGEDSGTLDTQLGIAANYYSSELGHRLKRLTALFEPLVIIVMGLIVGFVAIALVSAMYGIFNQVNLQ